jgi:hypothetical protein
MEERYLWKDVSSYMSLGAQKTDQVRQLLTAAPVGGPRVLGC